MEGERKREREREEMEEERVEDAGKGNIEPCRFKVSVSHCKSTRARL